MNYFFFTLCITRLRTGYLFVHMRADGSVFCQRLRVRRSGGQLVLTELRAEMGKQERQARHEVSGTRPRTSWAKQTCMPHMLRLIIVVWKREKQKKTSLYIVSLHPHIDPSTPAAVSSEACRECTASKSALAWTEFLLNPVPHTHCWPRLRATSEIAWNTRCCWDFAP